jgi:phospholipid transport system substrate-binding protein
MLSSGLAEAQSAPMAPDALIKQLSTDVIESVKSDKAIQAGDVSKIVALVDAKVLPNLDFQRMTASAVGRAWRTATPDQQKQLEDEFKILLVRTYAGALTQVKDQTVTVKPMRAAPDDGDVVVHTEVKGSKSDPIELDYRLSKTDAGWKIYDINVVGVWLVDQYRNTFSQWLASGGVDGLISKLSEKNKAAKG